MSGATPGLWDGNGHAGPPSSPPPTKATDDFLRAVPKVYGDNHVLNIACDKDGRRFVAAIASRWNAVRRADGTYDAPLPSTGSQAGDRSVLSVRTAPGFLAHPPWSTRRIFEHVPESHCLNPRNLSVQNTWVLGGTDVTVRILRHAWGQNIAFLDEPASLLFRVCEARIARDDARARMVAEFKLHGVLPKPPAGWVDRDDRPLAPYQMAAISFCIGREGSALYMDRGTGKTPIAIAKACLEARRIRTEQGRMARVLVLCPAQVRTNWVVEFDRFATAPGKVVVLRGTPIKRLRQILEGVGQDDECAFGAVVSSYESAVASLHHLSKIKWDLLICDESHMFKDPGTHRWRAVKVLRDVCDHRIGLTGTPVGNGFHDLWSQLELLGEGMSGFMSPKYFRRFYGKYITLPGSIGVQKLIEVTNLPMLQERLTQLAFSVTKAEARLNLPDKQLDVYEVDMTSKQAKVYEMIAEDLMARLEDKMTGDVDAMTVENILTQLLRLAQVTSGHVAWDPVIGADGLVVKAKRVEQIDTVNPKVEAVVSMLTAEDRDPLGKTIVWCCFVEDIRVLSARLESLGIRHVTYYGAKDFAEREAAVRMFNCDPECRVMVANPQTAAEGLNLVGYDLQHPDASPTYTDHEIFFSQNWSMILRSQAEDRAHRRGTRMPVRITDVVVAGTIDEEIRKRVVEKRLSADAITDVKAILRRVLGEHDVDEVGDIEEEGIENEASESSMMIEAAETAGEDE